MEVCYSRNTEFSFYNHINLTYMQYLYYIYDNDFRNQILPCKEIISYKIMKFSQWRLIHKEQIFVR